MINATIHVEGKSVKILHFDYGLSKQTDHLGMPINIISDLKGLEVTVEAEYDNFWWESIVNKRIFPKIVIELKPAVLGQQKTRYFNFYDCNLVYHRTRFDANGSMPMLETFVIVAQGLEQSDFDTVYATKFRKTYEDEAAPISSREEELQILDCYYTDLEGNEQAEPTVGEEVYLVLKTENGVGKVTDIDLSNQSKDFIYNGAVLENDMIKDFSITTDVHKIKLKVVAQDQTKLETLETN